MGASVPAVELWGFGEAAAGKTTCHKRGDGWGEAGRPVGEAPLVIDWGGELWLAGERTELPCADLYSVQAAGPNWRPRRVIIHRYFRLFRIWARRCHQGSIRTRQAFRSYGTRFLAVRGQSSIG